MELTQLDYDRELALVATLEQDGRETALGIARYVRDLDGKGCDFALVVADAFQGRGVGIGLMTALIDAARRVGVERVHGDVLAGNAPMLALMARLGFEAHMHPDDHQLVQVVRALAPYPGTT
jgi:acetyltransferase